MTPVRSIKNYCIWCMNGDKNEVKNCTSDDCPLYLYRFGKRPKTKNRLTPVKSIRKKCLDCSEDLADIRNCEKSECQLYPFRMGKNPNRKRN